MRRFPPPWTIEALDGGGFKIVDSHGQSLAYVYGHFDRSALAEFLAGADRRQRRLLKEIAEGLTLDAVGPAVPKTTH